MLHAVIMAGGSGTRFWPASRADRPKQLLRLTGQRTMLQQTFDRLQGLIPPDKIRVLTAERVLTAVAKQLPELNAGDILGEPCKRDTAPCIGLAALLIERADPGATMLVMPSDHVIGPVEKFQAAVRQASALVAASPRRIVTFGIRPSYPAETFGYVERAEPLAQANEKTGIAAAYRVKQFREKPKADVAREYLSAGNFYWNSGIFVWRARTILDELTARQPEMVSHLEKIATASGKVEFNSVFRREFEAVRGISIDYAVMEHAADVAVIEAPFDWDDLGNWQSLMRLRGTDADGNTVDAKHIGLNTRGSIVYGQSDHLIVTLGLKDTIIVHTPDATLVANRHDEESVRELAKELERRGWTEYL